MYHVVAATTNPAKIKAIAMAFEDIFGAEAFRIEGVDVDSGVPNQPIGSNETRTGARHRVIGARQVRPEADFWVGVEAGIEDNMTFAWMVIENMHQRGESRSASLMLPEIILQGINQGSELGDEMEKLTGIELHIPKEALIPYLHREIELRYKFLDESSIEPFSEPLTLQIEP